MKAELRDAVIGHVIADRVTRLEMDLVRIPSFTFEEAELAEYLMSYMDRIGLDVEMLEVPSPDGSVGKQPIGRLRGDGGGPTLLFCGHMDYMGRTEGQWEREPFEPVIEDGWLYGRGCKDEKGGLAAMVSAAEALIEAGAPLKGNVIYAPVMGHKREGVGVRHLLASGVTADMAIVTENSDNGVSTVCGGRVTGLIRITGEPWWFYDPATDKRPAHYAEKLARVIRAMGPNNQPGDPKTGWMTFEPYDRLPTFPRFNILKVSTEDSEGPCASIEFWVRTVPGQTDATMRADLERLLTGLAREDGDLKWDVEIYSPSQEPHSIAEDHAMVQSVIRWHRQVTGEEPEVGEKPRMGHVGDSAYLEQAGIPTLLYGPGTIRIFEFWPAMDERILLDDIVTAAKVYALTTLDLCG